MDRNFFKYKSKPFLIYQENKGQKISYNNRDAFMAPFTFTQRRFIFGMNGVHFYTLYRGKNVADVACSLPLPLARPRHGGGGHGDHHQGEDQRTESR